MRACVLRAAFAAGLCLGAARSGAEILIYRVTADFVSSSITSGPLAGASGEIHAELHFDTSVAPTSGDANLLTWSAGIGRVVGATASVGELRVRYTIDDGQESYQDGFDLAPSLWVDQFSVSGSDFSPDNSAGLGFSLIAVGDDIDVFTAVDWTFPRQEPAVIDLAPFDNTRRVLIYGPTGASSIVGYITAMEIVRPDSCVADVTTTGTNPGDAGYGEPDGEVDGADLSFFVEFWVGGCP